MPQRSKADRCGVSQRVGRIERPITLSSLNDYTGRTKAGARFPAAYVAAFCEVVGDDSLQRLILGQRLRDLIDIGETELASVRSRRKKDARLARLLAEAERKEAEERKE